MKITVGELRRLIAEAIGAKTMLPPNDPYGEMDPRDLALIGVKNFDAGAKKRLTTMADRFGADSDEFLKRWEAMAASDASAKEKRDKSEKLLAQLRAMGDPSSEDYGQNADPDAPTLPPKMRN